MSLINDALRRASQAQKRQPREAPIDSPMEPVAAGAHASRLPMIAATALVVVVVMAGWFLWKWWDTQNKTLDEIGTGRPNLLRSLMGKRKAKLASTTAGTSEAPIASVSSPETKVSTAPPPAVPETAPPAASTMVVEYRPSPAPATTPPAPPVSTAPAATPATASPASPTPAPSPTANVAQTAQSAPPPAPTPAPVPFPTMKVTAVFYRASNSFAVVNGKRAAVGDKVDGVLVQKIEPQRVILEFYGQTKEFLIDGP